MNHTVTCDTDRMRSAAKLLRERGSSYLARTPRAFKVQPARWCRAAHTDAAKLYTQYSRTRAKKKCHFVNGTICARVTDLINRWRDNTPKLLCVSTIGRSIDGLFTRGLALEALQKIYKVVKFMLKHDKKIVLKKFDEQSTAF